MVRRVERVVLATRLCGVASIMLLSGTGHWDVIDKAG